MLDQGFLPSATRVAEACASQRQMALFSATVSPKVEELIQKLFADAETIRSQGSHQVVSGLKTENLRVPDGKRYPILEEEHLANALSKAAPSSSPTPASNATSSPRR